MNTNLLTTSRRSTRPRAFPAPRLAPPAPAIYIGTLNGFRELPPIDLFNLLAPVGEHPAGSTVSRRTLERHGFAVPRDPSDQPNARPQPTLLQPQHELSVAC
jgi:hypothetical protein